MKNKKNTSQRELEMRRLKHRIVQEKGYSEATAEHHFRRPYNPAEVRSTVIYWDIALQGWRTFQAENLQEWRAVV